MFIQAVKLELQWNQVNHGLYKKIPIWLEEIGPEYWTPTQKLEHCTVSMTVYYKYIFSIHCIVDQKSEMAHHCNRLVAMIPKV